MNFMLLGSLAGTLLGLLMAFLSLFLILLILIQRGKGGGLTGALGGPGGQSAFGSKAGDTFTVITVVVASVWGFTCAFTMWLLGTHTPSPVADTSVSAGPGDEAPGNESVIPPLGGEEEAGEGLPGAGGIGPPGGIGAPADTPDQTPSADLVPATGEIEEPAGDAEDQAESPANGS